MTLDSVYWSNQLLQHNVTVNEWISVLLFIKLIHEKRIYNLNIIIHKTYTVTLSHFRCLAKKSAKTRHVVKFSVAISAHTVRLCLATPSLFHLRTQNQKKLMSLGAALPQLYMWQMGYFQSNTGKPTGVLSGLTPICVALVRIQTSVPGQTVLRRESLQFARHLPSVVLILIKWRKSWRASM